MANVMSVDPAYVIKKLASANLRNFDIDFDEWEEFSDDRIKWHSLLSQRLYVSEIEVRR